MLWYLRYEHVNICKNLTTFMLGIHCCSCCIIFGLDSILFPLQLEQRTYCILFIHVSQTPKCTLEFQKLAQTLETNIIKSSKTWKQGGSTCVACKMNFGWVPNSCSDYFPWCPHLCTYMKSPQPTCEHWDHGRSCMHHPHAQVCPSHKICATSTDLL